MATRDGQHALKKKQKKQSNIIVCYLFMVASNKHHFTEESFWVERHGSTKEHHEGTQKHHWKVSFAVVDKLILFN